MSQNNYASVSDLRLYYEIHGKGQPLIMLHGGLGTIEMFGQILPGLAENRQVIAVELQGHGHTADIDRPLSFQSMADDIAALIKQLGPGTADLLGYSLGGGVALQTAIRHPELVRKLVIVSATCKREGWYPEVLASMAAINADIAKTWIGSPMHQAYSSVAPYPEHWPELAAKIGDLLRQDYDWSASVAAIKAPTLIAVGDADGVRTAHAVELFELLGGGKQDAGWDGSGMSNARLAILPGTTHYSITSAPMLPAIVESFLDAPMPAQA